MKECLTDYFAALSNENNSEFNFLDKNVKALSMNLMVNKQLDVKIS